MNFLKLIFSTSGQDQFKNVAESAASVAVSSLRVFLIYFFYYFFIAALYWYELCYAGGRGAANVGGMVSGRGGMTGVRGMGPGRAGGARGGGFPQPGQSHVAQHTSA